MIALDFEVYKRSDDLPEITNPKIYVSSKQEKFHSEGLYSEQIFGPVKKFRCQCGKLFGKMNAGAICEACLVECGDTDSRTSNFAKIAFPEGICVVNPNFKNILQQMFGQNAIKSLLAKKDYQTNKELPYFFSLEKHKLLKESKIKVSEKRIEFPVYDIMTLKELFDKVRAMPEYLPMMESFVMHPDFLDFIFLDYVLVIPPSSRQIIKISPTKILPHPITKSYSQILKNKAKNISISDQLFKANPDFFGYTVYKYQQTVDEIYETILEFNFQKKESYIREALTGKTIEFSQRAVVIPNPTLKPYQIGMHMDAVKKLFLPELLHYLYTKYQDNPINDENFAIIDFVQYVYKAFDRDFSISIKDEDFREFLIKHINDFKVLVERQPTLWRYNISGYSLANVFDDNDILRFGAENIEEEVDEDFDLYEQLQSPVNEDIDLDATNDIDLFNELAKEKEVDENLIEDFSDMNSLFEPGEDNDN